jgi:ABC-type transport system involved in cytochrome c biogenesis permease subunit
VVRDAFFIPMINIVLFGLYPLAFIRVRLIIVALMVHVIFIVSAAMRLGRIPLIGTRDTLGFLAWSIGVVYLFYGWRRNRDLYTWVTIPLILLLLAGSVLSPAMRGPLPPVLRTIWFELHVLLSFVSYALFAIGAVFGLLILTHQDGSAEQRQYHAILLGYVLFSAAMVFGGIWAYLAWGTYWLWTPKELWTTIVWFSYSLYLHARLVKRWSGRPVAWMAIAGFVIVLFTYVGVGLLMKSSHEF